MTGYQQGILLATGCQMGDRYCVRNIDRWYCDAVSNLMGTNAYGVESRGKIQWRIKSPRVVAPTLQDVTDWKGFCRAWIEIHGVLDSPKRRNKKTLRLRIYGQENVLTQIMNRLPATKKKIGYIKNIVEEIYEGETCCIYYQSAREVLDILDYIDGELKNSNVWTKWNDIIN